MHRILREAGKAIILTEVGKDIEENMVMAMETNMGTKALCKIVVIMEDFIADIISTVMAMSTALGIGRGREIGMGMGVDLGTIVGKKIIKKNKFKDILPKLNLLKNHKKI